ncbi:alkyl sulfatase dimerization domain-containing protein [Rhizobium sp. L1K21]|uniref:alkyl sulfatase dimerization domain-containing protein n=1 Tax=Rhizobium sp. L1K21 TaxID=2954933 RepID=UPI00209335F0|nr:alkyl sulfatase dimerization domain-containing protein [Rhizobium sp. L1K21]MCO6188494.1 MBL fold metallo-hydrolase [Rhizobium sp. L1K21]
MTEDEDAPAVRVLSGAEGIRELGSYALILPAQGNALAVRTDSGVVLVDSGPGGGVTARMIAALRAWSDAPVRAICYSHGHAGYNDGVRDWLTHAVGRGDPAPLLIAQANLPRRYARYRETEGLQRHLNRIQFPQFPQWRPSEVLVDPNLTFESVLELEGNPAITLFAAPSETDDALALWIPSEGLLYAGAAFPGTTIANVGTPLRTQRFSIRWAETLERLAALEAQTLVTEFGRVVEGKDHVRERLVTTAEALRWLRCEVVKRMNEGMTEAEILHDIVPPPELFDKPWMSERYGAVDYIVRDLWREENGWWDRNPTSLHPAHPDDAAEAILSALTDHTAVLARAKELAAAGKTQLALHVIDLLALAPGDSPNIVEARLFKAELCQRRAGEVRPYVSKALYGSSATLFQDGRRR